MNLSFLPGQLRLFKTRDGDYVITVKDEEVFRGRVEKKAITQFNALRAEMEKEFPAHELTKEEKTAALLGSIMDAKLVEVRNSTKVPKKDRIARTRTFG